MAWFDRRGTPASVHVRDEDAACSQGRGVSISARQRSRAGSWRSLSRAVFLIWQPLQTA